MANQEHLTILRQGVNIWNKWIQEHPEIYSDDSDIRRYDAPNGPYQYRPNIQGANLSSANLRYFNLDLSSANLRYVDLSSANLSGVNLRSADLYGADLSYANLSYAKLGSADLSYTDLRFANLYGADLYGGVDLSSAMIGGTAFGRLDLRAVKGLKAVKHWGPSSIGTDTIVYSEGDIPEVFLREAGLPDTFIDYALALAQHPIEYYSCFISYSSKDDAFAKRLYADLQSHNVRCWFAPEDMKIGDRIRDRIDQSIRLYDKLLLILSEHSVMSEWVEDEVEAAMERERLTREGGEGRVVLFPVRLDDLVKTTTKAWASKLRRQRHIGDFTHWKEHDEYQKAFDRLLRDLKAEAQKMGSRDGATNRHIGDFTRQKYDEQAFERLLRDLKAEDGTTNGG